MTERSDEAARLARARLPEGLRPETLAVRTALAPSQHGENSEGLFLTSAFIQPDAETSARRFAEMEDFTYGRTSNPTVRSLEARLAAMEGAEAAVATATGMSAILLLVMGLLKAGDHVVCSRSVFGSTISLFAKEFAKFGVDTSFVSQTDLAEWRAAMRPSTKLLFAETPTNPLTDVCDIAALAGIAHEAGALLTVDNTFCSPALQRPLALGADLVMHAGTKYLDGQGRVMAGALCGPQRLIHDVFGATLRTAGMTLSPFNAWVVLKGLETLALRMKAQSDAALAVALAVTVERIKKRLAQRDAAPGGERPLSAADLEQVLGRLARQINPGAEPADRLKWIQATVGQAIQMIPVEDVLFFISDEKYTRVQTAQLEALIRKPIKELVEELDMNLFWQIHRSTLVNTKAIAGVTRDLRGRQLVSVRGHPEKLEVSRSYAGLFKGM